MPACSVKPTLIVELCKRLSHLRCLALYENFGVDCMHASNIAVRQPGGKNHHSGLHSITLLESPLFNLLSRFLSAGRALQFLSDCEVLQQQVLSSYSIRTETCMYTYVQRRNLNIQYWIPLLHGYMKRKHYNCEKKYSSTV